MYRFYCPTLSEQTHNLVIKDRHEIHHLKDVLRYKVGNSIRVFNGQGIEAEGTIKSLRTDHVEILCGQFLIDRDPPPSRIILACAIPKKSKFETIIEKATELGVNEIIPLKTQRTEISLSSDRAQKKEIRYETIAINAAKQSQRRNLPKILPITSFKEALKQIDKESLALIPCLTAENRQSFCEALNRASNPKKVIVFIGPEGDFTPEEIRLALNAGCLPVSLGETVLKVETAALAVVAYIRFHLAGL